MQTELNWAEKRLITISADMEEINEDLDRIEDKLDQIIISRQ